MIRLLFAYYKKLDKKLNEEIPANMDIMIHIIANMIGNNNINNTPVSLSLILFNVESILFRYV